MASYQASKQTQNQLQEKKQDKNLPLIKILTSAESQIKMALPKHINPERMMRIFITEIRKNPKLSECTVPSFLGSVIQACQLGLEPGDGLGQAYFVPYYNKKQRGYECQLIIGYQGKIDIAERDPRLTLTANTVYEKDDFDYEDGTDPWIKHKSYLGQENPGNIVCSYAVATYKDGRRKIRIVPRWEIEKAKNSSQFSGAGSIWDKNFGEMSMKTAVHRLFKKIPKNAEIAKAQELDDRIEAGASQDFSQVIEETGLSSVVDDMKEKQESFIETSSSSASSTDIDKEAFDSSLEEHVRAVNVLFARLKVAPDSQAEIVEKIHGTPLNDLEKKIKEILEGA